MQHIDAELCIMCRIGHGKTSGYCITSDIEYDTIVVTIMFVGVNADTILKTLTSYVTIFEP